MGNRIQNFAKEWNAGKKLGLTKIKPTPNVANQHAGNSTVIETYKEVAIPDTSETGKSQTVHRTLRLEWQIDPFLSFTSMSRSVHV